MMRSLLHTALPLGALLLSGACRSTQIETTLEDSRVRIEGVPADDVPTLIERIDADLRRHASRAGRLADLDDAAFALRQYYRDLGHAFADARFQPPGPDGRVAFEVDPGPRVALRDLRVAGALWLGPEASARKFAFPAGSIDGTPVEWFTRAALEDGLERLEQDYYEAGYLDVSASVVEVDLDRTAAEARVLVDVVEGPRFRVRRIELINEEPELDPLVRGILRDYSDRPFTPDSVYTLRAGLLEALGNAGFPDAWVDVRPEVERSIGAADLRVFVEPGRLVTVGDVRIEGSRSTRRGYVISRLRLRPGDRYSRERARQSFERLYRSGLFERVAVRLEESDAEERALIIELSELPSQEVFVEPGYGAYELARFKAGYRERNLFGTGRQFRAEAVTSVRSIGAEIGVSDPDFFDEDLFADLSVGYEERDEPSFTREELAATFSLRWPWLANLDGNVAYEWRSTEISDVDLAADNEFVASEDVDTSSVTFSPQFDSRDNLFIPTAGATAEFGIEWASSLIGSEIDFVRPTLTGTRYFDFGTRGETVLALGARVGWIVPSAETELIPLQERFFNGGPTTVRAFRRYELGPQDAQDNPLGGEGQTIFNVELRQRIAGKLHGALFYDAGSVVLDYQELAEFAEYAGGPGFGLRYMLPIGPLRVDVAFNADPGVNDDEFVVHLAVGMPF